LSWHTDGATDGMVLLDGGEFLMGTDDRYGFPADVEGPVRRIRLRPFWIHPWRSPTSASPASILRRDARI
jgi:hypothetical protein